MHYTSTLADKHTTLPRNVRILLPPDEGLGKPENSQIPYEHLNHLKTKRRLF